MNHIAILLTVFNRKEKTIKCLRNITAQSLPADTKFDIYIVDGGSTDGTVESVKTQFPHGDPQGEEIDMKEEFEIK